MKKFDNVPTPVIILWIGKEEEKLENDNTTNHKRGAACKNITNLKAELLLRGVSIHPLGG